MTKSIDERVVQMRFDNAEFERRVASTMAALSNLKNSLKLEGAAKGFDEVSAASKRFDLNPVASALDTIVSKFHALSVVGLTALSNIADRAVNAGLTLARSVTTEPLVSGLREYETNLNSIQTILSNTQWQNTGLVDVNKALDELNRYSDQTIYNFSEMARNIGTFTAAGVKLDVATGAIKGIANLAAVSGSNAEQASAAMYQLSQALAAGKVSLMDWNSVVNAGMGGKVFQDALIETARVHGVAIDSMIKEEGSFRNTLQKGWLTSGILTETLNKFTGDLTEAQLKSMGYNDQQIAGILKMGQTAQDAATKVKTMSQLISTLQEAAGSGWAKTWQVIFGDFEEARDLFSNVSDVLGGFINKSSETRNKVLGDWKELGGRTVLIEAISNSFQALISIIKPIGAAFREIFPATTGRQLYELTASIRDFTSNLKIGAGTAENLRRTFAGVFAIFGIGASIIKEAIKVLFSLLGVTVQGSGGILEITARFGDFVVRMREAIREGNALTQFFSFIGRILVVPIKLLQLLAAQLGLLFGKFDGNAAADAVENFVSKLSPLGRLTNIGIGAWEKLPGILRDVLRNFAPIADKVGGFFKNLTAGIVEGIQTMDFNKVIEIVKTGLLGGLVTSLISFIARLRGGFDGDSFFEQISNTIDELTSTLQSMQNTLRAATLLQIAAAIALLTVSVIGLSKVDAEGLTRALSAMAVMFGQLFGTLILFEKFATAGDVGKIIVISASLILLATAVDVLSIAVKSLASLSWNDLAKGLTGVTVLLAALTAAVNFMPTQTKMIGVSVGLILLAAGVKILASAVTDLAGLSWEEMARGLTGVAGLLLALGLFTKFATAEKAGVLSGVGILLLAVGIKVLASALADLGQLSWGEIARGLTAMAGGLTLIAAALVVVPPSSIFSAAAVLIVAASLGIIADALQKMGGFSWESIAKGIVTLAGALVLIAAALILIPPSSILSAAAILVVAMSLGMIADALASLGGMSWGAIGKSLLMLAASLTIIAIAMIAMTEALPGAAALLVVAASLMLLAPVLKLFGNMSWGEIAKGLLMLAGVFTVLGLAGVVLTPLVPTLLGLGLAITLIGIGVLAAGAGVLLFSAGLTALSVSGAAATAVLVGMIAAFVGLLPVIGTQLAAAVISFSAGIAKGGAALLAAFTTLLGSLIDAVVQLIPKIVDAVFKLLSKIQDAMVQYAPKLANTGLQLLTVLLNIIAMNLHRVITAATNVIVAFINGISDNLGRVIDAGVNLIISFVNGIADAIRNNSDRMNAAGFNLASAIISGMTGGLSMGIGKVRDAAISVAKGALEAAMNFLGAHSPARKFIELGQYSDQGLAIGLTRYGYLVEASASALAKTAAGSMAAALSDMSDMINANMDTEPSIRPVLDLTDLRKNVGQIDKVLAGARSITLDTTQTQTAQASSSFEKKPGTDDQPPTAPSTTLNYTQNNYSPKPLPPVEIYRQTKNQLSLAKGGLSSNGN